MRNSILVSLALVVALSSCTTYKAAKFEPVPQPPMVDKSEPVAFRKILVKIPYDTVVGYIHEGFGKEEQKWEANTFEGSARFSEMGSKMLKNQGYNVIESSDDLFGTNAASKARYQLAGTITGMMFNLVSVDYVVTSGIQVDISLQVEWQLYDSFKEAVVLKETLAGEHFEEKYLKLEDLIYKGFENSLRKLLNNKDFIKAVTTATSRRPRSRTASRSATPRAPEPSPGRPTSPSSFPRS
ncbi:MAG: hypothetical protein HC888_15400 [Candidatus Competibacteraceae bacterium]|nr:hypothetical protein [Candidatus Competibacteraceae bacterium]